MANKTFDGFVHLGNGSVSTGDVHYQAYFFDNGTASSPSSWNNVRTVEGSGYYNINLGDADWLGVSGVALPGALVLIVFWKGNTLDRNSLCSGPNKLEEWGTVELDVTSLDVYTNATQVKPNEVPIVHWTLTSNGLVDTSYIANNTSYDVHTWSFGAIDMHHYRTRYGQDIQLINTVVISSYDWDDGAQDNNLPGTSNGLHRWTNSGAYDVELVIEDECSATSQDILNIEIRNRQPIPNITCVQTQDNTIATPNTVVSFYYSGTDLDDKISSIDWLIKDSGTYGNTDTTIAGSSRDTVANHTEGLGTSWCSNQASSGAFTNPGNHTVSILITWFDGFNTLQINYEEVFVQALFSGPAVKFTQSPPKATLMETTTFTNTTTGATRVGTGLPDCNQYDWSFTASGILKDEVKDTPYNYRYSLTPETEDVKVKLCANWNNGWDNKYTCLEKELIFDTKITVEPVDCYYSLDIVGTSDDGSVSGYGWEIYKDTTISGSGPWEELWKSPIDLEQKTKFIAFTETGYFKIVGSVYGNGTTTDDEILYIDEVCKEVENYNIWDGTGILDLPGDWGRLGFGEESEEASYTGTNGLNIVNMLGVHNITFKKPVGSLNVNGYGSLTMYINLQQATPLQDIYVSLNGPEQVEIKTIKLSNYISIRELNKWQKVLIDLSEFELTVSEGQGDPTYIDTVTITTKNIISFYLDVVEFGVCGNEGKEYIPVTVPNLFANETGLRATKIYESGKKLLQGDLAIPSVMSNKEEEIKPPSMGSNKIDTSLYTKDQTPKLNTLPKF